MIAIKKRALFVGDKVTLKVPMLGCNIGDVGVVYEEYDLGDGHGASVIFSNGLYDGFSPDEQEKFLKKIGRCDDVKGYSFTNVIRLERDFREGVFNKAF